MTGVRRVFLMERQGHGHGVEVVDTADLWFDTHGDTERRCGVVYDLPYFDHIHHRLLYRLWWALPSDPGDLFVLDEEG